MKVQQIGRKFSWLLTLGVLMLLAVAALAANGARPAEAAGSSRVALVGSASCSNGGGLPTVGLPGGPFSFTNVAPANVATQVTFSASAVGPGYYDTVALMVCSPDMYCNSNYLNNFAGAETALKQFVSDGGKLIIYDGECHGPHPNSATDTAPQSPSNTYNWLPPGYRMETNFGWTTTYIAGQLTIEEQNILSKSPSNSPYYINVAKLSEDYSEVGDANYMATHEPQWCVDMSTNKSNPGTPVAWVHAYARYGPGLMIYNGLDLDQAGNELGGPTGAAPYGLQRIWLQELQAPLNPTASELPCTTRGDVPLPCAPAPAHMVAWWPLDETKGVPTIHDIRDSHDSSAWLGLFNAQNFGAGMVGGALDFSNSATFVTVPNASQLEPGGGDFSIDAWVYPVTTGPNVIQPIVDKWDPGLPPLLPATGYAFYIQSGLLMFQFSDGTPAGTGTVSSFATIPYDEWSHVAVTLQRGVGGSATIQPYINGQPKGGISQRSLGVISNSKDLLIGGTRITEPAGQGEIALDEVEIFDTAVPQAAIQAIFNALSSGKCPVQIGAPVGGVAALTVSGSGSPVPWTPLAAVAAGVMAVMGAGLWYGRRRWLR